MTIFLWSFGGCKKAGKGLSEKIIKESVEESSEMISKRVGKSSLNELGEKVIKGLDYDNFIVLLKRDFPIIYTSFDQFDKGFQKDFVKIINKTPRTLDLLLSSKTLLDEFVVATAKTPSLGKNVSFFYLLYCSSAICLRHNF